MTLKAPSGSVRAWKEPLPASNSGPTPRRAKSDFLSTNPKAISYQLTYQAAGTPLIVFAGQEYGTGSSRDWAAKGTRLLGVKAVVAQSFERIHRSNLVGMGVLPLQFPEGISAQSLNLDGTETYDITGLSDSIQPRQDVTLTITRKDGTKVEQTVILRIDTPIEVDYYRHGGILPFVLRQLVAEAK